MRWKWLLPLFATFVPLCQSQATASAPTFVLNPLPRPFTPGRSTFLHCKASGDPPPTITWEKDGETISNRKVQPRRLADGSSRLYILRTTVADAGVYRCLAKSSLGTVASEPAKLSVRRRGSRPVIVSGPNYVKLRKGETIRLSCKADGYPNPRYTWYKDGGQLSHSHDRFTIEENGTLLITNAQLGDSAHYRCSAYNHHGRASAAGRVKVNLAIPESKPVFTSKPRSASVAEGTIVEFTCIARGQPYPDTSWWNNNRRVYSDDQISVSNGGQHLRIQNAEPKHQGVYLCRAENNLGKVETKVTLKVESKGNRETAIKTTSAKEGSTMELKCDAMEEMDESPDVLYWTKDNRILQRSPNFDPLPDGILMIYNVTKEMAGVYECVAKTGRDKRTTKALLNVLDGRNLYNVEEDENTDEVVINQIDEASNDVESAIATTEERLKESKSQRDKIHVVKFPNPKDREAAKGNEVYELSFSRANVDLSNGLDNLRISNDDLELLANVSGCETHRNRRNIDCSTDMCFHKKYRTIDGTCNNFGWSKSKKYNGFLLPSARDVSNKLAKASKIVADPELSHMVMQWGQFLDHDLDFAMEAVSRQTFNDGITCSATCDNDPPCFPIPIPDDDQRVTDRTCMEFTRSSGACGSGSTSQLFGRRIRTREQINQLTSFIDGSQVYGSTDEFAIGLRNLTNDFGRLREGLTYDYSTKPFMPFNENHPVDCRRDYTESNIGCFLAGDVRVNEHLGLTAMHNLWFREHNKLAYQLRHLNPHWDGDTLYEEARKILWSEMQHITFTQWLPLIVGASGMKRIGPYSGYNPKIDPSISNVFSASAFRFGHTMVNPVLVRLNKTFQPIAEGNVSLRDAFFAPWRLVQEGGIDPILRGLVSSPSKSISPNQLINEELTDHLFEDAHAMALDLAAFNIQRGRDHGLPSYHDYRRLCGLTDDKINSWDDLNDDINDQDIRNKLKSLYGHPENIDVWMGGLLETPLQDGRVGPLVSCLIAEQFQRLRDGDRFWYENPDVFSSSQLRQIKQISLARILCDNGDDIDEMPPNVFKQIGGENPLKSCRQIDEVRIEPWSDCREEERLKRSSNEELNGVLARLKAAEAKIRELETKAEL